VNAEDFPVAITGGLSARAAPRPTSPSFDEVVAQLHIARMQPGATIAVFVDPQNPADMAIDWIPHRSARPAATRFRTGCGRAEGAPGGVTSRS
jgi:hypothetical protein